jgi:pyrimidine deaminase RibD-like protein
MINCALGSLNETFTHVAALKSKGTNSFFSMGTNHLRGKCSRNCNGRSPHCSKHAEKAAIDNFSRFKGAKDKNIELVVIRVSPTGVIGNSKPCFQCIQQIMKSRFNISKVYYSNAEGDIICENINQLLRSDTIHIAFGLREKLGYCSAEIPVIMLLQNKKLAKFLITKY